MADFHAAVALFLLFNLAAGLVRVVRGPTPADRMLAAQLAGTTGAGILLLLAEAGGPAAARDVALVLAVLAAMAALAFVRRPWTDPALARDEQEAAAPPAVPGAAPDGPRR